MSKLLCSVVSGPAQDDDSTYFNKPVNLAYVRSVAVGVDDSKYYIDFDGVDVRWYFTTVEEMESAYGNVINHEF